MIDFDEMKRDSHDPWSDRDRLPRDPQHKQQRLRVFASHLPPEGREYDLTVFRVDSKNSLLLQDRGNLVAAFAPGSWSSFESIAIPDDDTDDA